MEETLMGGGLGKTEALAMLCAEEHDISVEVTKSTEVCWVDSSAEVCVVGGGRTKTLDTGSGKNDSGLKSQQEEEPSSFIKGITFVHPEQRLHVADVLQTSVGTPRGWMEAAKPWKHWKSD